MPRPAAPHGIVGEIAYRIDGLSTDRVDLLMQKGVKQDALDGRESLRRETII
jgi:hypothetical protein